MNVLIVGSKGFIGQNLFYQLKENKKFNILLLDKDSSPESSCSDYTSLIMLFFKKCFSLK